MDVDEKRAVVERLTTRIRESETMIVTDYRGLSVTQMAEVRAQLREAGATFQITKNTLARIAAADAEKPDLVEFLEGPTAIAFVTDDAPAAAKKLGEIARQTRILTVRGRPRILAGRNVPGRDRGRRRRRQDDAGRAAACERRLRRPWGEAALVSCL